MPSSSVQRSARACSPPLQRRSLHTGRCRIPVTMPWYGQSRTARCPTRMFQSRLSGCPLSLLLMQAAMTAQFNMLPNGVLAIPQMRESGIPVKIMSTLLRYHPDGHSADLWVTKDLALQDDAGSQRARLSPSFPVKRKT